MDNDYDTVTKGFTAAVTVNINFTECRVVLFNNTSTNDGANKANVMIENSEVLITDNTSLYGGIVIFSEFNVSTQQITALLKNNKNLFSGIQSAIMMLNFSKATFRAPSSISFFIIQPNSVED